jgi:hypothetical protein
VGHEVIVHGSITGATYKSGSDDLYRFLQNRNGEVLATLVHPEADQWPWLNRSMFSLPGPWPQGTYQQQVIHFGASIKDDAPHENTFEELWLSKFEALLRKLYWFGACVIIESDFGPPKYIEWLPTTDAISRMVGGELQPISDWERRVYALRGATLPAQVCT